MEKMQWFILLLFLYGFVFASCMSTYGFHTAKTLEQGEVEVSWDASASAILQTTGTDAGFVAFHYTPGIDLTMRFGTAVEHLDWGFQLHPQSPLGGDVKYQFYGDRKSLIALATGIGVGFVPRLTTLRSEFFDTQTELPNLWAVTLPLYATIDWGDKFMFTLSPNYRIYLGPQTRAQVVVLHSNIRFRLRKGEWATSYFVIEGHAGTSISGNPGLDHLQLFGAALGYQAVFAGFGHKKKKRK